MINPPTFILKRYAGEFWSLVGVHFSPIIVPYPNYRFHYTSAGDNSGLTVNVNLDAPPLDALSKTLGQKIHWVKSAAGQRALMTARLRGWIKDRDHHPCQNPSCGVSISVEPNAVLEVDHIIPVSKDALSEPENLQALCWRCNRTKGAKSPRDDASLPSSRCVGLTMSWEKPLAPQTSAAS